MIPICLDCGCHSPSDSHGDPRHITLQDVERAAQASGISRLQAAERILAEVQRVVKDWKQRVGAEQ